ncbi:hypothetical protein HKBW3S44_01163, partial [Candidatus Hakubella thermalkaliphila]
GSGGNSTGADHLGNRMVEIFCAQSWGHYSKEARNSHMVFVARFHMAVFRAGCYFVSLVNFLRELASKGSLMYKYIMKRGVPGGQK